MSNEELTFMEVLGAFQDKHHDLTPDQLWVVEQLCDIYAGIPDDWTPSDDGGVAAAITEATIQATTKAYDEGYADAREQA